MINEDYKKLTSFLEKKIKDYEKFFSSYRQKNKIKFNKFPKKINYIEHNIDKLLENSSSMLTVLNTINLDEKFTIKLLAHQSIELSLKALYLLTGNIEKSDKQWKKHEFIIDSNKLSKSSSHFFSLIASIKKHPSIRLLEKNFYLTERYGIEENLELFGLSRFNPSPINDNSLDFKDIIYCTNLIYLIVKNYRLNFLLPTKENSKEYTGDLKSGDFKICKNFLYFKDYCLCKDTFEGSNDNFFCCLSEISDFSKNFIKTLKKSNIISKKKNWDSPVQIILETTTPVLINHIIIHRKFNENRRIQHDINSFN
uniref:hypothetical protein n=1 Tax=uncultured Clostridium sp. TaxID=59620 RepID=UPI00262BCC2B